MHASRPRIAPTSLWLSLALVLVFPAVSMPPRQGVEFVVDSTVDEVDADLTDGLCASASGACTMRAAVMQTNALPGHDTVRLPEGTVPNLSLQGAGEDGSLTGDLDILDDLSIVGEGMMVSGPEASNLSDRALHVHNGVRLVLSGVSFFWANAGSQSGGGLLNEGTVSMTETSLQFNRAENGAGVVNAGEMTILRSLVGYNTAAQAGGGIFNSGTLTIEQSTIPSNEVDSGPAGGILNQGNLTIRNSTISQNRSTSGAGAVQNGPGGSVTINNATIFLNAVPAGGSGDPGSGGLFNDSSGAIELSNSIVAMNAFGPSYTEADCRGTIISSGYNLIRSTADCDLTGDTSSNLVGVDPLLPATPTVEPIGTWAYPPLAGSPAIDAGNPADVGSSATACEIIDQLGHARPIGFRCDIGAIESEFGAVGTPSWTPTEVVVPDTPTATDTASPTDTYTPTATPSSTYTPVVTLSFTPTGTQPTPTPSITRSRTPTRTPSRTPTRTNTPNITLTFTATATYTASSTPTWTATATTPPAPADFWVSSGNDEIDGNPGDGLCASPTGECTLRAAVMEANALPGLNIIWLPGGGYGYALSIQGTGEEGARTGDLDILDEVDIVGQGMTVTGIAANGLNDRVFHVHTSVAYFGLRGVSVFGANAGTQDGGALLNESDNAQIFETSFQSTVARDGGALLNTGTLRIEQSLFFANTASGFGGGVRNEGSLYLNRSTVAQSQAGAGGGAISNTAFLTVRNSTISSNTALDGAAAIHNGATGWTSLNNTTIYANYAQPGGIDPSGGIANTEGGSVDLSNTILAANADPSGYSNCRGPITSAGYNLLGSIAGCGFSSSPGDQTGVEDPKLGMLTENPDGTGSHPLLPGSPAIDAGNPGDPWWGPPACETVDQRGVSRPQGAACDIGAYEEDGTLPTPTPSPTPSPTVTPTLGPSRAWQVSGSSDSNFFGRSVSGQGDVNGDGYDDVMVGAPGHREYENNEGAAFIYFGGPQGPGTDPDWQVQSNVLGASLGNAVDLAGDVNGDGFDDVLVGANNLATGSGAVYAYYGGPTGPATSPAWTTFGQGAYELYGWSVAMAGDVNADGFGDVLVGAPQFTDGQSQEGRVSLYLGSASGLGLAPDWQVEGGQTEAGYGYAVAAAGDVNGDGYDDILVSAYNYINNVRGSGPVYLYSGSAQGPSTTAAWIGEPTSAFDGYGRDISGAGDVNADGFDDFLIGAPGQHDQIEGKALLYLGSSSGPGSTPAWAGADGTITSLYGYNVAGDCDVNNDGYDDFAVGDQNFPQGGAVFYYLGGSSGPAPEATWSTRGTGAYSGALRSGGRVDDDGYCEFMVGAPMDGTGKAYLYFGFSPYPTTPTVTPSPIPPPTSTWTSTPTSTSTPTPTAGPSPLFSDGFESGDLSAWTSSLTDAGDLSVTTDAAIGGSFGLQAVLDDNRSIYVVDDTPTSEAAYNARFYFDPNGIQMASGNSHILLLARDAAGVVAFRVELRSFQGDYQVRAAAPRDAAAAYATPWVTLRDAPHFFEVAWRSATGDLAADGSLWLFVDSETQAGSDGLDNDTRRVDSVRLGAVSGVDAGTRGTTFFDSFVSTQGATIGPDPSIDLPTPTTTPDPIFGDGFESGDLSAWSTIKNGGDLSVTLGAAHDGAYGMLALIDDATPRFVSDWTPFAEQEYHARFVFDPNSLAMLDGRSHAIFQGLQGSGQVVARVELRFKSANYELRAGLLAADGRWTNTSWWYIEDGPQVIEIAWRASQPAAADGSLTLWINEVQSESRDGIANDGQRIDFVRLGIVAGVDAGTLGSMYFDTFESRRETYIGVP